MLHMLWFLLTIMFSIGLCGRLHIVFTNPGENEIKMGTIDPTSGEMDKVKPIILPTTECNPGWVLGNGTHGQTSAVFYQNGSLFFFAQEHCQNTIGNTTLFMLRIWSEGNTYAIAKFPELDQQPENSPLHYHVSWDWTCNLIVVVRRYHEMNGQTTWDYRSVEVSAYNGEKRELPDQGSDTSSCKNCWHWVDGVSGVDNSFNMYVNHSVHNQTKSSHNHSNSSHNHSLHNQGNWSHDKEDNCVGCVFYTLEEQIVNYEIQKPRRLIGRGVHNGSLVINASDRFQMQAISYMGGRYGFSPVNYFIGLGVCCELSWCPRECEGHGGKLSLIYWPRSNFSYSVLLVLDQKYDELDDSTIKMGIATDIGGFPINSTSYAGRISLWIAKKIYSYKIIGDKYDVHAENIAESPSLTIKPLMWGYFPF